MPYDPTGFVSHEDELHRSQTWKRYCRAATTASITIATALNNGDSLDGITLATGDRVLVKDQSSGAQNGIYVVGVTPARAFDMDQDGTTSVVGKEVVGAVIEVTEGTVNGGTFWRCTNTGTPILGTTALTFAQFGAGASLTIKDEGSSLATSATSIDFVGAGVTASGTGAAKTVTIPGGAATLDDLTDVTITSAATADRLRFDGSLWRNSALVWKNVMVLDPTSGNYLPVTTGAGEAVYTEAP